MFRWRKKEAWNNSPRFAKVAAEKKKALQENSADPSSAAIARWTHS